MSIGSIIYNILIMPLQLFFEVLFMVANRVLDNPGLSIIALSLAMNFLVLPLYRRADAMQEEERDIENKLRDGVAHIKKTFKGDERMMILSTYYRQNHYKPTSVFKGSVSLFLEIPFFIAAYRFLSHLELLQGVPFGVISDLGAADGLIHLAGLNINLLPLLMTGINLISCTIFTKGYPAKTKIQLYGMALFFLIYLYDSPSGLVFYWTLNNIFSLVKTIFYKLKDPKKVLRILFAAVGAVILIFAVGFYHTVFKVKLVLICLGVICLLPLLFHFLKEHSSYKGHFPVLQHNSKVFWSGAVYLIILVGLVIPSAVIGASPQEFVDVSVYLNPLWYVCSALCLAVGTFAVWCGVFYWLAGTKYRVFFDLGVWIICGIATADYMFFGKDLGLLNNSLQYEEEMLFSGSQMLMNLIVVLLVTVVLFLIYRHTRTLSAQILMAGSIALAIMSVVNMAQINRSVADLSDVAAAADDDQPQFHLSTTGKNVIVIMLDRGMNEYIPYFLNEKPELKEMFSGFTYYPNTISYGPSTNFGSPAVYGGYEYTPLEMNARSSESLVSKHNEALKVMPVLFDENDYAVTVCDPTYAGYNWIPDLSIYDEYPDIQTYNTSGVFESTENKQLKISNRKRNFFCYSLMKAVPLFIQNTLYDDGNYNNGAAASTDSTDTQVINDAYTADGISSVFMNAYSVLENLPSMTHITENDTNTFLMMSNDTTHEVSLLQEPDYAPSEHVDNREYEEAHADRFTVEGVTLKMENDDQHAAYESNMAALLQLGKWLDYLKENDVYDNTRIIIAADHGCDTRQIESLMLDGTEDNYLYDTENYYPLLMVKDFDSEEFTVSEEFMTNADVPTLAAQDLIENPVNPFTEKEITSDEKNAHPQYVFGSAEWSTSVNSGNTFLPGIWFEVSGDRRNLSSWKVLQTDSISPFSPIQ